MLYRQSMKNNFGTKLSSLFILRIPIYLFMIDEKIKSKQSKKIDGVRSIDLFQIF